MSTVAEKQTLVVVLQLGMAYVHHLDSPAASAFHSATPRAASFQMASFFGSRWPIQMYLHC